MEVSGEIQSKKDNSNRTLDYQRQYYFVDKHVVIIFHLLKKGNKLKLPEARHPDEVGRTNDPNYYLFHRMINHPTSRCNVFKNKIQALIKADVLTLKSGQKRANV